MVDYVTWAGLSGTNYRYEILQPGSHIAAVAGLYIFAKQSLLGWQAIYIGQAGDLNARLGNHERMPCIREHGFTHLHLAGVPGGEDARCKQEADLIARWQPPCNTQGRLAAALAGRP